MSTYDVPCSARHGTPHSATVRDIVSPSNTTVEQLDRRLESLEGARTLVAGVRVQHTLEAIGAGGADGLVAGDQRLLAGDQRLPRAYYESKLKSTEEKEDGYAQREGEVKRVIEAWQQLKTWQVLKVEERSFALLILVVVG